MTGLVETPELPLSTITAVLQRQRTTSAVKSFEPRISRGAERDRSADFTEAGVRRFGISRDSPWTHIAWQQVLDVDFPLLSDFNGDATHAFGIAFDYRGLRDVSERTAFLIDQGGTVRGAWRYESSEVPDVDELLSAARALQG